MNGKHFLVRSHERQVGGLVRVDDSCPGRRVKYHSTREGAVRVGGGFRRNEGAEVAASVPEDDGGTGTERGLPVEG